MYNTLDTCTLSGDHVPPAASLPAASDPHHADWLRVHNHRRGLRALHHRPRPLHPDQGEGHFIVNSALFANHSDTLSVRSVKFLFVLT